MPKFQQDLILKNINEAENPFKDICLFEELKTYIENLSVEEFDIIK